MPRAKKRTPELRHHVLGVAVDLLETQGTSGFTARGIARRAETSTPAVYELFGDKSGLVRDVYFEGFRRLRRYFDVVDETGDPVADLKELLGVYRRFLQENRELADVMFSRPFTDFDAAPCEREASSSVRTFIVDAVARATEAGRLRGDPTDIAHVLVALVQGLGAAENARRFGTSAASVDRRWHLAVDAVLEGLRP